MRKKYLSALLFGALLVTSAGTFTSCKDYDDDINNLQEQITANADAIKALQDKINSGKWITELTSIEGGFKVTFSDGQSFEIVNGKEGAAGSEWTIGEDGFWYKDGEKTEYKAAVGETTGKVVVPTIKDGLWYIVDEETGELVATEYKANGAAYAVAEANGGFTIYMPNEDGTDVETIYIPGAAGAITSIETVIKETGTANNKLDINKFVFDYDGDGAKAFAKLTGKTIPAINYILTSDESFELRVNPVNVDAATVEFSMINSKNEVLPFVKLAASEYKDYVTVGTDGTTSRAAYGNGLYTLNMKKVEVKDDAALKTLTDLEQTSEDANIAYAVSADLACRGEYNVGVKVSGATANIGKYKINNTEITVDDADGSRTTVDTKATNTVSVEYPSHLYDMWLSAATEDVNLFELKFDQEKHTFSVNADPDKITKSYFDLTITTLNNDGVFKQVVERIQVSSRIVAEAEYAKITHNIVAEEAKDGFEVKNFFTADMSTMTTALGSNLDTWKKNVINASVKFYNDEACKDADEVTNAACVSLSFLASNNAETALDDVDNATIKSAAKMKFSVDNDNHSGFEVDKTYYAKVTFSGKEGVLNSVVIPFEFKIPALSTMLTPRAGYVSDGVINAYFYDAVSHSTAVELNRYFTINNDAVKESAVDFTDDNKYSDGAYLKETSDATFGTSKVDINGVFDDKVPAGYGKAVTIKLSNEKYLGWSYQADADKVYTFKICLMSPIYEGTIAPVSGTSISISANDVVNGAKITDKDITGVDYNGNKYCVVSDKVNATGETPNATWYKNSQIKSVTMTKDKDSYIDNVTYQKATSSEDGVVNGWFIVKGRSLSVTQEIELPVTVEDAWGYKKTVNVPATIVVK